MNGIIGNTVVNNQFEYNVGKKFVLGEVDGAYTFADGENYLSGTENTQNLVLSAELTDFSKWSISFGNDNKVSISNQNTTNNYISYYANNKYFNCYTSSSYLYLYKQITDKEYSVTPDAEKCHVTYDANGGINPPTDPTEYEIGALVTVLGPGEMSREGHTFDCWSDMQDGNANEAILYEPEETFTISENTTLYAQWTTNSYSFVLNTSGNVLASLYVDETELQDNETIQFGKEVTVEVAVNPGYIYTVSVTNNNTQEDVVVIKDKFTMPASDITVTVTETALQNYTITYYVNGVVATTQNVIEGNAATLPTENDITVPNGFKFVGWSLSNSEPEIISSLKPIQDVTLYAVFNNQDQYVRVTQDLGTDWAGRYLIAYNDNTFANGQIGGTSGIGKAGVKVDLSTYISNNTIPSNIGDQYYVELEEITPGSNTYVLKTQDGKYNYHTNNTGNGLSANTKDKADDYPITVSFKSEDTINLCLGGEALGAVFRYNSSSNGYFRFYKDCGQQPVYLYKKTVGRYYTRVISQNEVATGDIVIENPTIIPSGSVLDMGEHTITSTDPNNLIIEDGGQLIVNNSDVMATFKKSIEATPTAKTTGGGWYSIASPVNNVAISSVTNLVDNADHSLRYNLYRYNETSSKWEAYNTTNHADFTTLANGQGYLYRNNGMELSFTGEVNHGDVVVNLTNRATNTELKGFNLIGNPFGHNIYKGSGAAIDNANLSEGFYYLTYNGEWQAGDGSKAITPQMGVLVQVTGEAFELTISDNNSQPNTRYANDNLQFIVSNNEYQDVAYAKFSKGYGLNKISHRNSEVPMLYIPQNGERYAIAMMSDNTEMFALNFKAATMGRYTLSYKAEGEFSYLHVIDRLTGDDVDMLLEGEYSFTASPKDNESRFIVRLAYKPDYSNEGNEVFVYQNGDEILVSGEGELQVFDATGRLVRNMSINGAKSLNISTQGVYIFRLVGNEVKTQKIVVR